MNRPTTPTNAAVTYGYMQEPGELGDSVTTNGIDTNVPRPGWRPPYSTSVMSRPCAVNAQITVMAIAIIVIDQTGYYGSQAKFTMALITATITPTVRAQTAPRNSQMPASRTMMPPMRWIHPQVVASNCRK